MKLFIPLFALLFFSANLLAQSEEPISLETSTGTIKGTLLTATDKTPVVLIIAGSGPTDRNGNNPMMTNNSLKMLAEGLQQNGIASVRYDKRGIAESANAGIKETDLRFHHFIDDAKAWIEQLEKDDRFSEVIVLGHSEGSLIGMISCQATKVTKFISLAGVGEPAGVIMKKQLNAQPPVIANKALPILESLIKGKTVENVPQMLYAFLRPSVQPYMISWFQYDPRIEIAKLVIPVFAVQGDTDLQVEVSNVKELVSSNKNVKHKIIEGMNHVLKEAPLDRNLNMQTYTNPSLPIKQELIPEVIEFIKS